MKLVSKKKSFSICKEALDFIDTLAKKRKSGNLHSHKVTSTYKGKPGKKLVSYSWSVTWKGKANA